MTGLLIARFRMLLRKPVPFILTTAACILFASIMGISTSAKMEIPVFSTLPELEVNALVQGLNKNESFEFVVLDEEEAKSKVSEGSAEAAIHLKDDSFILFRSGNTQNEQLIYRVVESFYKETQQKTAFIELMGNTESANEKWQEMKDNPILDISIKSYKDDADWVYDESLQSLFGFVLFFSIFTVAFNVVEILRDKQNGMWDRLILSPVSKGAMYTANLLYGLILGYVQIALVLIVFKYVAGVNFYGSFVKTLLLIIPYLFTVVALSLLISSLVTTMGQFNAVIPLIGVSFAMLGGAYWPIEIVSSKIILGISKVIPVTYGMEILKGATIYGQGYGELLPQIGILVVMGIVMMVVGIRLMERRHV